MSEFNDRETGLTGGVSEDTGETGSVSGDMVNTAEPAETGRPADIGDTVAMGEHGHPTDNAENMQAQGMNANVTEDVRDMSAAVINDPAAAVAPNAPGDDTPGLFSEKSFAAGDPGNMAYGGQGGNVPQMNIPYNNGGQQGYGMNAPQMNAPYNNAGQQGYGMNAPRNVPYNNGGQQGYGMNTPQNVPYNSVGQQGCGNAPQMNAPYNNGYGQPGYGPAYGNAYYSQPGYAYVPPQRTPVIAAVPEKNEEKKPSKALVIIIVLLILGMLSAVMIMLAIDHSKQDGSAPKSSESLMTERESHSGDGVTVNINVQSKPSEDEADYQDMEKGLYTTTGVAKHITPSIVSLYGYTTTTIVPYSAATGVIISEEGYIITNAHFLEDLTRIKAVTNDGREFEAEIIGSEPQCDLAVLQIDAEGLVPAELGSSSELLQGEQVVAIGNSAGYENTLTVGYVSYVDREISSYTGYPIKCIQTDAALNSGISGGALVNMYGQVVGITTSKSIMDNNENIGFAISMDFAAPLLEDLIEKGYVSGRPRVGVQYRLIDYNSAQALGVKPGMLIAEISEDCDISNTELQTDDIITEIDGIEMTSDEALRRFQSSHKAGDRVTAKVYRKTITNEESEFEITFRLEEQTD